MVRFSDGELFSVEKEIIDFFLECWRDDLLKTKEIIDGHNDTLRTILSVFLICFLRMSLLFTLPMFQDLFSLFFFIVDSLVSNSMAPKGELASLQKKVEDRADYYP